MCIVEGTPAPPRAKAAGQGRAGWRPLGLAVDLAAAGISIAACGYIVVNYDRIMTTLPWATTLDMALTAGVVLAVLLVLLDVVHGGVARSARRWTQ